MLTFSLQSGSNGNAIYVEAGDTRLLFDAGISGKQVRGRLRLRDRSADDLDAVILSHDHSDHVRCAGVLHRMFKAPLYLTKPTHEAIYINLGKLREVRYFHSGDTVCIKDVKIHTIRTPHDAADGVGFVVEHDGKRLGILTDLGHPFAVLRDVIAELDAVYLESNYDPHMLETGPYPPHLQARISGAAGHLSNGESAELIRAAGCRLQWAALSHLSHQNNEPQLALEAHYQTVGRMFPFVVASRYEVGDLLTV